jgi:hypothetical protein
VAENGARLIVLPELATTGVLGDVARTSVLLEQDSGYGERVYGYVMDQESSVDIDTPFGLELAECLTRQGIA